MRFSLLCGLAAAAFAGAADVTSCQSCTQAVGELLKQVPVLSKKNTREGDKELALGDALPTMCSGNVFSGFEGAAEMAAACKGFAKPGGALEAALLKGEPAAAACAAQCEGVAEADRAPKAKAPAKARKEAAPKGGKPAPRKGSVDDPAYKEALKKKAARDFKRHNVPIGKKGKKVEADEAEAAGGAGDL